MRNSREPATSEARAGPMPSMAVSSPMSGMSPERSSTFSRSIASFPTPRLPPVPSIRVSSSMSERAVTPRRTSLSRGRSSGGILAIRSSTMVFMTIMTSLDGPPIQSFKAICEKTAGMEYKIEYNRSDQQKEAE